MKAHGIKSLVGKGDDETAVYFLIDVLLDKVRGESGNRVRKEVGRSQETGAGYREKSRTLQKAQMPWKDEIHFAPPTKPWNDESPVNTNKRYGFQWIQSGANGFRPSTVCWFSLAMRTHEMLVEVFLKMGLGPLKWLDSF